MRTYRFTIYFRGSDYMSEETADALYEAGCDDCSPASGEGRAYAGFDRDAESLEAAITSAVREIRRAGLELDHVEIDEQEVAQMAATS